MIELHNDRDAFRDLLTMTAGRTGFLARLIEKDYYCSVILEDLTANCPGLVFKGGTCLAKVYSGFHRMSEDLDFTIPVEAVASRPARSRLTVPLKTAMAAIGERLPVFRTTVALHGANSSTQYNATLAYRSALVGEDETIKIEVALREAAIESPTLAPARTILMGPMSDSPIVNDVRVLCLTRNEAMAEKVRAALTRREPAIRDFFDIDHVVAQRQIDVNEPSFLALVRRKLDVPGTPAPDLSAGRLDALRSQLMTDLRPVVRGADFDAFDLDRVIETMRSVVLALETVP